MPDMEEISRYCKQEGLLLIEDCAEAIGSKFRKQRSGLFGDAAAFSFFGNKTITTGEGGMAMKKEKENYLLKKKNYPSFGKI